MRVPCTHYERVTITTLIQHSTAYRNSPKNIESNFSNENEAK